MHFPVNIFNVLELDRLTQKKNGLWLSSFCIDLPIEFVPMLKKIVETVKKTKVNCPKFKKKNEIVKLYLNFLYATTQKKEQQ